MMIPVIAEEFNLDHRATSRRANYIVIDGAKYYIGELIGIGGNGEVYAAREQARGPNHLVFKHLRKMRAEAASNEADVMSALSESAAAQYFPNFMGFYSIPDHGHAILMNRVSGMTLNHLIRSGMEEAKIRTIGRALIQAILAMHNEGFAHRDIKPTNVIVSGDDTVTIIDLGAAMKHPEAVSTAKVCTVRWASPQMHRGRYIPAANDAWGVGLILYKMATGSHPFPIVCCKTFNRELVITSAQVEEVVNQVEPASLRRLVGRLLDIDEVQRLVNFKAALESTFMA